MLSLATALGAFLALVWRFDFLVDDAFIAFRYAAHWATGEGLRYHLGTDTPVEGFSNPLWVALLALGKCLGLAPELCSRLISVTCSTICIVLLHSVLEKTLRLGATAVFLGTLFLALFPPFAVWATGGLETGAFSLVLFASWRQLRFGGTETRAARVLGVLLPLLLVGLRVEGVLWATFLALLVRPANATHEKVADPVPALRRTFLVTTLLGFALLTLLRLWWFGDAIPNTVHAKSGFSMDVLLRGYRTLTSFGLVHLSVPLLFLFLPAILRGSRGSTARSAGLIALGLAAWNVLVGGDWMPFFRFLAPAAPFLALLFAIALEPRTQGQAGMAARLRPWVLGLSACALSIAPSFDLHPVPRPLRESMDFRSFRTGYQSEWERWQTGVRNVENFERIGRGIAQVGRSDATLVTGAIGALGYYSDANILDRNGLVDRRIARGPVTAARSAGHDKRVPRAWFIADRPTWYEVLFVDHQITGGRIEAFHRATAVLHGLVFADAAEATLLDCTQVVAFPLRGEGPIPDGSSLILLQHTNDPQVARDFWQSFGP
jgi:hypothetical protein